MLITRIGVAVGLLAFGAFGVVVEIGDDVAAGGLAGAVGVAEPEGVEAGEVDAGTVGVIGTDVTVGGTVVGVDVALPFVAVGATVGGTPRVGSTQPVAAWITVEAVES